MNLQQKITLSHYHFRPIFVNRKTDGTNQIIPNSNYHCEDFSIFQVAIVFAFMKGRSFSETAKFIRVSLSRFHSMYRQMLEKTGTTNRKALLSFCKKIPIFSN